MRHKNVVHQYLFPFNITVKKTLNKEIYTERTT